MVDIHKHRRILDTLTGPIERPVLHWLAAHLPAWVTPDILTSIGVIGGLIVFLGYWMSGLSPAFLWLATLGFVVNWFGDSLDGTLARYRHIERPVYGFYIDHAVDAYIIILVFAGVGFSPYARFDLAIVALLGYMLLNVLVLLRTAAKGEFAISYSRLGPTEARLIAIGANTLVFFIGNPKLVVFNTSLSVYDWILVGLSLILYSIAILTTIRQAYILSDWDRKKRLEKTAPTRSRMVRRKARDQRAAARSAARRFPAGTEPGSQD